MSQSTASLGGVFELSRNLYLHRSMSSHQASTSIEFVIHAKCQHLIALIDDFRRNRRDQGRCSRKANTGRAKINIFVFSHNGPFAGQRLLDAAADGPAQAVNSSPRDLPGRGAAEIKTERAMAPGRTRLRIVERAVVRIADTTGHECERANPRAAVLSVDPLVGVARPMVSCTGLCAVKMDGHSRIGG